MIDIDFDDDNGRDEVSVKLTTLLPDVSSITLRTDEVPYECVIVDDVEDTMEFDIYSVVLTVFTVVALVISLRAEIN